jgi:hypothetical protein
MYFVYLYENRKMKPVEIVLRRGEIRENDGGSEFNIHCKPNVNVIKCYLKG